MKKWLRKGGKEMTYLFSAYSIIWLFIAGYLYFLGRRQKQAIKDLKFLQDFIEKSQTKD